jgi:hypothetical protein
VKRKAEPKVANAYYGGDPVAQGGGADWESSSHGPASRPYSPKCLEKPSEKVSKVPDVCSLTDHRTGLLGPFWLAYTAQIHGRSAARTPFSDGFGRDVLGSLEKVGLGEGSLPAGSRDSYRCAKCRAKTCKKGRSRRPHSPWGCAKNHPFWVKIAPRPCGRLVGAK